MMPLMRRTLVAFVVTFCCALAVFTIPSIAWNSLRAEAAPVAQDSVRVEAMLIAEPAAAPPPRSLPQRLVGLLGIVAFVGIAVALSHNRKAISPRVLAWGLGLQALLAVLVLRVPAGREIFVKLGAAITALLGYSYAGTELVFGELGKQHSSIGMVFAFQVLPAIIFVSALFAILYYLGVMQLVVGLFARVMHRTMGASGAESMNVAASIFMGQTEAPLTIRPFLSKMTQSELMTIMTAGMAHVSGSIMAAYIAFGVEARHLLTAVIMTAPGTVLMAKLMEPETGQPETLGKVSTDIPRIDANVVAAAARGTGEGLQLMLNVIAMLISFVALVALVNGLLGWGHSHVAFIPANVQTVLGFLFRPIAWLMGVPWVDTGTIGGLLGTRMVLNEFIAYAELGKLKEMLQPASFTIATFALCGFANISSVGIQIGGIGALAPERKQDLARLGFRAMIAGTLANFVSASLAGLLL
jgi:CNT family concentrative nucleoside transporter